MCGMLQSLCAIFALFFFFVTQSRVLSKIGGGSGQGRPNTIAIHQVHCQGECDPLSPKSQ